MSKHGIVAVCLASLVAGMFIGSFFINHTTVALCERLTNHPAEKGPKP
jgi:hypothetical protein